MNMNMITDIKTLVKEKTKLEEPDKYQVIFLNDNIYPHLQ